MVAGKCLRKVTDEANETLSKLSNWFAANELTLNADKSCFTIFTNKKQIPKIKLILSGKEIKLKNKQNI